MSVLSWAVIIAKSAQLVRLKRQGTRVEKHFWQAASLDAAYAQFGSAVSGNPYITLVDAGREAKDSHTSSHLEEVLSPDEWLKRCLGIALEERLAYLSRGLAALASVGSTAPFVGLFGTVWGIYHALLGISAAGQSNLAQVAGPVGESLVMTAFGLFVAIPAVLGYNAIARGHRGVAHKLHRFRHELHAYLMSGARRHPAPYVAEAPVKNVIQRAS